MRYLQFNPYTPIELKRCVVVLILLLLSLWADHTVFGQTILKDLPEVPELPEMPELPEVPEIPEVSELGEVNVGGFSLYTFSKSNFRFEQDTNKRYNREYRYKSSDTFSSVELVYKGKIELSDDDTEIKSISSGGYLKFSKKTFGNKRSVIVESGKSGALDWEYYEGNKERDYEEDGKEWFSSVLPEILRITGIGAESRVKRIYAQSGVGGVLDEISSVSSSSVKGIYFDYLLEQPNLSSEDYRKVALKIGSSVSSSSEQGSLFRRYSKEFTKNDDVAKAYFSGISRISSSSERGSILRKVLSTHSLSKGMMIDLLETTSEISSSSEKGSVLSHVNQVFQNDPEVIQAYFRTLDRVSSSSTRGSVLREMLREQKLDDNSMRLLFQSTSRISSSSEQGSILRTSIPYVSGNASVMEDFFYTVDRISSSSEKGSVLRQVAKEVDLDKESVGLFVESTRNISSSSEQGSVLRAILTQTKGDVPEEFFRAIQGISSSSEKGRVLRTLLKQSDLSDKSLLSVLESVRYVSSSSEQGSILIEASDKINKSNSQLVEAYKRAASSISSDSEYRRVMNALN